MLYKRRLVAAPLALLYVAYAWKTFADPVWLGYGPPCHEWLVCLTPPPAVVLFLVLSLPGLLAGILAGMGAMLFMIPPELGIYVGALGIALFYYKWMVHGKSWLAGMWRHIKPSLKWPQQDEHQRTSV